jgi:6-phosphofructokinase 2
MSKIITITFSPSVDKSATIAKLVPEKKMHCYAAKSEPGGGGINVARVLSMLGNNVTAIFPVGGCIGSHLSELMRNENVPFSVVQTKNETRENFTIFEESSKKQYRFGMLGNELHKKELTECLRLIENEGNIDFIVASGSLPDGVPPSVYAQLSNIAKTHGAKLVIDTSGDALKGAIEEEVYLLKPNVEELGILIGNNALKKKDIEPSARALINKKKCEIIVISLGADGAMMVTKEKTYTIKPPKVIVKSTVGAGDSMVAGLVFGLSNGKSMESSLKYGVACGTAATMNLGSALCKKEDVEKLLKKLDKV